MSKITRCDFCGEEIKVHPTQITVTREGGTPITKDICEGCLQLWEKIREFGLPKMMKLMRAFGVFK